jgi:hypothetical protein
LDNHDIWRRVEHDFAAALARRPAGHQPVVLVSIAGRSAPLVLGFVETRRDPGDRWVRFQSGWSSKEVDEGNPLPPRTWWCHVPENAILSVEIEYRKEGTDEIPIGFTFNDVTIEPPPAIAAA